MRGSLSRALLLATAAFAGLGSAATAATELVSKFAQAAAPTVRRDAQAQRRSWAGRSNRRRFAGLGWSVKHGQRLALKRRNQQRHKRACRGRR